MRRLILFLILMLILSGGAFAKKDSGGGQVIELNYNFTQPVTGKYGAYDTVEVSGLNSLGSIGKPEIPFKTTFILLPFGEDVENITLAAGNKKFIGKDFYVKPAPALIPVGFNATHETEPDALIYDSSDEFPGDLYSVNSIQKMSGYHFLVVDLYPVSYVPKTGELFYFENMTLTVKTKPASKNLISNSGSDSDSGNFRGNPKDRERITGIVDNGNDAGILNSYPPYSNTNKLQGGISYDYVIITSSALNASTGNRTFQNLSDRKNQKGVKTIIVTVERIVNNSDYSCDGIRGDGCGNGSQFNDTQAKVRNFIKDANLNWNTTYVLLGGDDEIIPHRGFYCNVTGFFLNLSYVTEIDANIPADVYYSNLDGSFDYNNNGLYAEPNDGCGGGEVDLFSEVYVGRAPVSTEEEVSNFVKKTIEYENSTGSYLKKTLMLGEFLSNDPVNATPPGTWGKDSMEEVRFGSGKYGLNSTGFFNYFEIDTLYDKDMGSWSAGDLIPKINDGVHIISHLGHANFLTDMRLTTSDIPSLNNTNYFFGYSQGCYAGAFDCPGQTNIGYCSDDSIAEYFLKNEHGAFAFISNSRYGLATDTGETNGPSQFHNRMFFNEIFGENNTNLGKANQNAKESLADFVGAADGGMRWVYYNVNLLGDPETQIYVNYSLIQLPDFTVLNVSFNPQKPAGQDTVIITASAVNNGNINLNLINVNFSLFVDDVYESSVLLNLTNITLTEVNFNRTAFAGEHNITVKVDPGNEIPEQKESNNNFTIGLKIFLPCDLNRDGITYHDWNDLSAAYKCFLGIGNCNKINYMNWAAVSSEYKCFLGQ